MENTMTVIEKIMSKIDSSEEMAKMVENHIIDLHFIDKVHNTSHATALLIKVIEELKKAK